MSIPAGQPGEVNVQADSVPLPMAELLPRQSKVVTWLMLGCALLLAAGPMLWMLDVSQVVDPREARTLATSLQTFDRHGPMTRKDLGMESFVPYFNGRERLAEAPGLTWLHLGIFQLLPHEQIDPAMAVLVGRLTSAALALLCVAAVFWAGFSLAGTAGGFMAALVCAANPVFLYHGRVANPQIAFTALATLSMAAALWAIRPLRPAPTVIRQVIGWTTCGLAASGALLVLGPGAGPIIALPVLVVVLVVPRRTGHLLGLVAATCIAALTVAPWAIFAHGLEPDVWRWWAMDWILTTYWLDMDPLSIAAVMGARLLIMLLAMLPWTLWLMAGVAQPFSTSSGGARTRLFVSWSWLVSMLVLFLAGPQIGRVAYLMVCLPAGAMVVAAVFHRFAELSEQQRPARLWRTLRWPQTLAVLIASAAIPVGLRCQSWLVQQGLIDQAAASWPGWWYAGALAGVLIGLGLLAGWLAAEDRPQSVLTVWGLWVLVLAAGLTVPLSRGPMATTGLQAEAREIARITQDSPAFWLQPEVGSAQPHPAILLYANRSLLPLKPSQVQRVLAEYPVLYLVGENAMAPRLPGMDQVAQLPGSGLTLWRVDQNQRR